MPDLKMFNFYDTEAVKTLVLNVLVENHQLREEAVFNAQNVNDWFNRYQKEKDRADAAEAKVAELEKVADSLAAERDAALAQQKGGSDR